MVGFEIGQDVSDGGAFSGTSSYDTGTVRTGARSFRCNPASGATGFWQSSPSASFANGKYTHFGLRIASMPSVARLIFGAAAGGVQLRLNTDGTLTYLHSGTVIASSTTTLTTGVWYWIGIRCITGTSVVIAQIDGVDAITGTVTVASATANYGCNGTEASAIDIYIDDIISDDAGFLQPSNVDTALPISDNTVTGVTDNNGGTSNIWECVNNTPPAGVASANEAANPAAGMHFPASTTCNYIANLESYTTLGINTGDTVLAVQTLVRHGEDIATGTKNLQNVGALTNPTVAGASVTAGNDGGAHGAEQGQWQPAVGTLTTSPSVTLGTSPTIRTSRISQSRLACLDFMGMTVAWTPAAAAATFAPPFRHNTRCIRVR